MGTMIFIPGILGSALALRGEEVWPPTLMEAKLGYGRIAQLADPATRSIGVIERVACFPVYEPVLRDLGDIARGLYGAAAAQVVAFHYDWRGDLRTAARELADLLDGEAAARNGDIVLIAHSMGGLIARWLLEGGGFTQRAFYSRVAKLVLIATPHGGAPEALARALGLAGASGLSAADTRRLAADPAFPSLYQLLPPPTETIAWSWAGPASAAIDIYDRDVAARLGLGPENLDAAIALRAGLGAPPAHVQYHAIAGTGHATCTRVDLRGGIVETGGQDANAGDGTVPLWSAALPGVQHELTPGEHLGVTRERGFRNILYRLMGAYPPSTPFADGAGRGAVSVSVDRLVYGPGEAIDVLLLLARPAERVEGTLMLDVLEEGARAPRPAGELGALKWEGGPVTQVRVALQAPKAAGAYRLRLEGVTHLTLEDEDMAMFAVQAL